MNAYYVANAKNTVSKYLFAKDFISKNLLNILQIEVYKMQATMSYYTNVTTYINSIFEMPMKRNLIVSRRPRLK